MHGMRGDPHWANSNLGGMIIINAFSALGENLHFVISDLVITGVYCIHWDIYSHFIIFKSIYWVDL